MGIIQRIPYSFAGGGSNGLLIDDFNDDIINEAIWAVFDSANVVETGGKMVMSTTLGGLGVTGITNKISNARAPGDYFQCVTNTTSSSNTLYGINNSGSAINWNGASTGYIYMRSAEIYTIVAGSSVYTGFNYVYGDNYTVRIEFGRSSDTSRGFQMFVQSDDDSNYTTEVRVFDGGTTTELSNNFFASIQTQATATVDDVYFYLF